VIGRTYEYVVPRSCGCSVSIVRRAKGSRIAAYNTNHSSVLGNIVGLYLLDESSRKEEAKEANDAEAQGPAP
jgi:hypothetical protein